MYDFDRNLEAKQARRMHAENRFLTKLEKREAEASHLIGELCREGKTLYYFYPVGSKYRESASHSALIDFIIRNKYVR